MEGIFVRLVVDLEADGERATLFSNQLVIIFNYFAETENFATIDRKFRCLIVRINPTSLHGVRQRNVTA
ncbi:MAG: hypothetical protein BGP17_09305 [Sphingomonas sp. 67-41]|nr:MAG: hypothetical protein BGP17_09305 [Sphingomonas sp. 67-41]